MTCDACGRALVVGDYPFCPHGAIRTSVNGDECDYWDDNLGHEPIHITSWSQRRQLMAERGLIEKVKWAGPNDRHVKRWDAPPAYIFPEGEARRRAHWHATEKD